MASWESIAFINSVKVLHDSVIVCLDEFHSGYKKKDGVVVDDKFYTYTTIWQPYYKKFITQHFSRGMLVHVKGSMLPYRVDNGAFVDGYTILGEHITMASYPRQNARKEMKMIRESQDSSPYMPDIEDYRTPDF